MKPSILVALWLGAGLVNFCGCDSQKDTVSQGQEAVKKAVAQPLDALEGAKDSLKQSEEKNKSALEEIDQELKQ
ncbi:MAG: hypothetical protein ACM3SP_15285 [Chloroflexota bacterium]